MVESEDQAAILSPGEQLRLKRQELGLELTDIADGLLLSVSQVEALEHNDWSRLPGSTYIMGYWRNYAALLELDISATIDAWRVELTDTHTSFVLAPQHQRAHSYQERLRKRSAVLFGVLFAVFLVGVWSWQSSDHQEDIGSDAGDAEREAVWGDDPDDAASKMVFLNGEGAVIALPKPNFSQDDTPVLTTDSVSPALKTEVANGSPVAENPIEENPVVGNPAEENPVAENPIEENPVAEDPIEESPIADNSVADNPVSVDEASGGGTESGVQEIEFIVTQSSWLALRDATGANLVYRILQAGENLSVSGVPPFSLIVGLAAGVEIRYLGETVAFEPNAGDQHARLQLPLSPTP